jgi:hypothetical protein
LITLLFQIVPGNALAVDNKKQFRPLTKFGGAFLNRFQVRKKLHRFGARQKMSLLSGTRQLFGRFRHNFVFSR